MASSSGQQQRRQQSDRIADSDGPFDGKNFLRWKIRTLAELRSAGGLDSYVTQAPPAEGERTDEWRRKNDEALRMVVGRLAGSHVSYGRDRTCARDVWARLEADFGRVRKPTGPLTRFTRKVADLRFDGRTTSLSAHLERFDALLDELKAAAGGPCDESVAVAALCSTLPPAEFDPVVESLQENGRESLADLMAGLVNRDTKIGLRRDDYRTDAAAVGGGEESNRRRRRRRRLGHEQSSTEFRFTCDRCGYGVHTANDCDKNLKQKRYNNYAFYKKIQKKVDANLADVLDSSWSF